MDTQERLRSQIKILQRAKSENDERFMIERDEAREALAAEREQALRFRDALKAILKTAREDELVKANPGFSIYALGRCGDIAEWALGGGAPLAARGTKR